MIKLHMIIMAVSVIRSTLHKGRQLLLNDKNTYYISNNSNSSNVNDDSIRITCQLWYINFDG